MDSKMFQTISSDRRDERSNATRPRVTRKSSIDDRSSERASTDTHTPIFMTQLSLSNLSPVRQSSSKRLRHTPSSASLIDSFSESLSSSRSLPDLNFQPSSAKRPFWKPPPLTRAQIIDDHSKLAQQAVAEDSVQLIRSVEDCHNFDLNRWKAQISAIATKSALIHATAVETRQNNREHLSNHSQLMARAFNKSQRLNKSLSQPVLKTWSKFESVD